RGDVRRGYFVRGLSGAQFALPEAVEMLRETAPGDEPVVVMTGGDPANVYGLPLPDTTMRDAFVRRRGRSALMASVAGQVMLVAGRRGASLSIRPCTTADDVTRASRLAPQRLASMS